MFKRKTQKTTKFNMTNYSIIKNIKRRRFAFLDDTANFYTSKNRGTKDFICNYSATKNSPGCAIGRHLFTNVAEILDNLGNIVLIFSDGYDHLLPKWMREMGQEFLSAVQCLHDDARIIKTENSESFWDKTGLTKTGKEQYEYIKIKYCI